jgi:hypothetical protein
MSPLSPFAPRVVTFTHRKARAMAQCDCENCAFVRSLNFWGGLFGAILLGAILGVIIALIRFYL